MTTTYDQAYAAINRLVADFKAHEARYLSPIYSEAEARKDFIDKFFAALGWDVDHLTQKNPYEQEVKVERSVTDNASKRRADYAFFIAPNFRDVRFFVEAKKPSRQIENADDCFQTIRYGWNSGTPLAVLTDFEQFVVLDCRYRPDIKTAMDRVVFKLHYSDYTDPDKFANLYWLFAREAVSSDSLNKFTANLPKRKGKTVQRGLLKTGVQSIDTAFLEELDSYRETLAKAFKKHNHDLDGETLTEIVQRTLDRLVFLRFLEDKLIENHIRVADFGNGVSAFRNFIAASRKLDDIYNGIVFKPHSLLDAPGFTVDETAFASVCRDLAHDQSPYDFNLIPIHILGSIYERFLGKVITTTDKRVKVEEKPEVRKAGGVYYTPDYIVRYIVAQTVGKLIEGKAPAQIAELKFADIACGSGSFLLGVFDCLLRYHREWYNAHPEQLPSLAISKGKKQKRSEAAPVFKHDDGTLHLTLAKKSEILLNNIFGVDLDQQATEVAQLSLYLKLLEDETPGSARGYLEGFGGALLPTLNKNIICGNSLIGTDILNGQLFSSEEERKLNPMNYESAFPEVMKRGGFDAIVGNPPYVRPHNLSAQVKEYLWAHYPTFTHKADLYCCFIEQATRLVKTAGLLSYIVSHGWLRLNSFQNLRNYILQNHRVVQLVELPSRVFQDAQVETGIFIFERIARRNMSALISILECKVETTGPIFSVIRTIPQQTFESTFQNVFDLSITPETETIKDRMRIGPTIGNLFSICFGLKTGDDKKFIHSERGLHAEDRPLLRGEDVKRYSYRHAGEYVWYVPTRMRAHKQTARPGEPLRFEQPKVLVKDTSTDFSGTYDDQHYYVKDVLIVIPRENVAQTIDLRFLTAVINSKALHFYYRTTFKTLHVQSEELASLPLPDVRIGSSGHDRMVTLVVQMLDAKQNFSASVTDKDRNYYDGRCNDLDRQINTLVYELYGLTEEEIRIVES